MFVLMVLLTTLLSTLSDSQQTDRPVIGILSQELSSTIQKYYGSEHHSYIAASYVKFIESAGARVAPIFIGQNASYYRLMAESVNGILFPGGATYFDDPSGYGAAGLMLYQEVMRINEGDDFLPLLGVCLGMELIAVAAAGGLSLDPRTTCDCHQLVENPAFLPGLLIPVGSHPIDHMLHRIVQSNKHEIKELWRSWQGHPL